MAISRGQLVKELEPGLNAYSAWSTKGMRINMLKFLTLKIQTELSKRVMLSVLQMHKQNQKVLQ